MRQPHAVFFSRGKHRREEPEGADHGLHAGHDLQECCKRCYLPFRNGAESLRAERGIGLRRQDDGSAHLSKALRRLRYDGRPILQDLDFEVFAGDYLCIVGENGSGKSTLMKTILRRDGYRRRAGADRRYAPGAGRHSGLRRAAPAHQEMIRFQGERYSDVA